LPPCPGPDDHPADDRRLARRAASLPAPAKEYSMSDSTHLLHDLVQISRTGTEFYEEAAKSIADKKLKRVFADMAKAKTALADNLAAELKPAPKRTKSGTEMLDEIRKTYTGIKTVNTASITQLEQTETQLQGSLQKVVMDRDHSFVVRVLAKQYVASAEVLKAGLRSSKRALS
jgi:uncharacterized protein (TIGR02284 family)